MVKFLTHFRKPIDILLVHMNSNYLIDPLFALTRRVEAFYNFLIHFFKPKNDLIMVFIINLVGQVICLQKDFFNNSHRAPFPSLNLCVLSTPPMTGIDSCLPRRGCHRGFPLATLATETQFIEYLQPFTFPWL